MPPLGHTFSCEPCGVICSSQYVLNSHLQGRKHRAMLRRDEPTICTLCNLDCSSPLWLTQHLNGRAHAKRLARLPESQQRDVKPASRASITSETGCELCQLSLPTAARRAAHEKSANHQRRLRFAEYQKQIKQSEDGKQGISISPSLIDFGIVDYSLDEKGDDDGVYVQYLTMRNSGKEDVELTAIIDMRQKHKSWSRPYIFAGRKLRLSANTSHRVPVSFDLQDRKAVGIYETRVRYQFQTSRSSNTFSISRVIKATVGNKAELDALKPIAPYVPRTIPSADSYIPQKDVIRGEKPPALAEINWVNHLPPYPVPLWLKEKIDRNAESPVSARIKALRNCVPAGWDSGSYQDKFDRLLWIEEEQLARDVRMYDIENAKLDKVPGGSLYELAYRLIDVGHV